MEINSLGDTGEFKLDMEMVEAICRSCLSTDKVMFDVYRYTEEIADLTGIRISPSDGLPRWLCVECRAVLWRATRFRRQWHRAHAMLYDYLTRCAPFPIDAQDPELRRYASPGLRRARTLAFDNAKSRQGFAKVLEHKKEVLPSPLEEFPLPQPLEGEAVLAGGEALPEMEVKREDGYSDYEDDIPLEDYKSSIDKLTAEDLEQLLNDTESLQLKHERPGKRGESPRRRTKKSRKKDEEGGSRKKKKNRHEEEQVELEAKPSLRRTAEDVDPAKIRVITLNPEEQLKQLEEESKLDGYWRLPFKCSLCFKGFNFENKLSNHMKRHSPSRGKFECSLCHTYLPTPYSFSVHMRVHTRRYECLKCGRRMVDRGSIIEHYRSQHEGIVSQFTCHLCGKLSSNSKTHRGHMRNHHSGARPECAHCGKTFVNKDSLADHILIHEGVKNYKCDKCDKCFRTKNQAKHHQLKHSDVRDHYCVECDVRFKSAHNLRQHLQKSLKHKDPKSFKFECLECCKRFESASSLDRHARVQHHGERAHVCKLCGAALASRASLMKHAKTHTQPKAPPSHVCHACGRAFRGKSVLLNHVRTHTGEKPFSCATCGRRFAQRTACRTHVRLVHLKLRRAKMKSDSVTVTTSTQGHVDQDVKPSLEAKLPDGLDDKMAPNDLASYADIPVYF